MINTAADAPSWLPPRLRFWWGQSSHDLLVATAVGEADDQGYDGMLAVCCVVRNRVERPCWWGKDWREVVLKKHQFTCWWAGYVDRAGAMRDAINLPHKYADAHAAADQVMGGCEDVTGGATHYYAPALIAPPAWTGTDAMMFTREIGGHKFYQEV